MKLSSTIFAASILLLGTAAGRGQDNAPAQPVPAMVGVDQSSDSGDDRMTPPPPVSAQPFPILLSSQERSNYLRGGVLFSSAYNDNAAVSVAGTPISDVSYSISPNIALDQTTARMHLALSYAPGFTFYRRESGRDENDQNATIHFEYRLSPHVTFSAGDQFQKSSNVFNQPDPSGAITVTGGTQGPNLFVVSPVADRLMNFGYVGLAYQYSRNAMVGASGNFSNVRYGDLSLVTGLSNGSNQGGGAYYAYRVSKINYFGVNYEFQRLASYPAEGNNITLTQAINFFYTIRPTESFSISVSGGPQYSNTTLAETSPVHSWTPEFGASLAWQGRLNSFAASYSHSISGGGGLVGAAQMDAGSLNFRQQIFKGLSASVGGAYTNNRSITASLPTTNAGHSILGTAQLNQQLGPHFNVLLGYARVHQIYGQLPIVAGTPDTNREFVSVSYQFSRPIGR